MNSKNFHVKKIGYGSGAGSGSESDQSEKFPIRVHNTVQSCDGKLSVESVPYLRKNVGSIQTRFNLKNLNGLPCWFYPQTKHLSPPSWWRRSSPCLPPTKKRNQPMDKEVSRMEEMFSDTIPVLYDHCLWRNPTSFKCLNVSSSNDNQCLGSG